MKTSQIMYGEKNNQLSENIKDKYFRKRKGKFRVFRKHKACTTESVCIEVCGINLLNYMDEDNLKIA